MIVYSDTTPDLKFTYNVHENQDIFYVTVNISTNENVEGVKVFEGSLDECVDYINKKIKE